MTVCTCVCACVCVRASVCVHLCACVLILDYKPSDITQWAVWAIRNICEENPANQAVIAQLEKREAASPGVLEMTGCEVEVGDDGHLRMKSRH